ncbi:Glycerate dehydrogenase [uncultured Clostridium sp.]|uniref:C-terminal binding protein n=1 Tax=Flintibacter sp. HCN-6482 TaxID=3134672 RepID=UPI000822520B|nr:Glycerate dehydrogenase [uncultured Clostridium sp.]
MNIFITDCDHEDTLQEEVVFAEAGMKFTLLQCKTEEDLIAQCQMADIILNQYAPITKKVMERLPNLKYVVRYGVGTDNIDVGAATELGIQVGNVPDYGMNEVADHALSCMIALVRKLPQMNHQTKNGTWDYRTSIPIRRLSTMTVGVIGMGRIGRNFARKASGLGMRVLGYDPYYTPKAEDRTEYITPVTVETLLQASDVISIHCPLNQARGMLDKSAMEMMKQGAYLINVARGGIVDEEALDWALESGHLAGAALDCMSKEPAPAKHPLFRHDNIILTPHMAWYSEEAAQELKRKIAEEAVRFARGEAIHYPVNHLTGLRR